MEPGLENQKIDAPVNKEVDMANFKDFTVKVLSSLRKGYRRFSKTNRKFGESVLIKTTLLSREPDFNIEEELEKVKGPYIEIGGPTATEYWFGLKLIDTKTLNKKVYVSNITPGVIIHMENGKTKQYGKVDFQADATKLPLKNNSIGALFASCLNGPIRADVLDEAYRVLEPDGLLLWQGGKQEDIEKAKSLGFVTKEVWSYSPRFASYNDFQAFNIVFQKIQATEVS